MPVDDPEESPQVAAIIILISLTQGRKAGIWDMVSRYIGEETPRAGRGASWNLHMRTAALVYSYYGAWQDARPFLGQTKSYWLDVGGPCHEGAAQDGFGL